MFIPSLDVFLAFTAASLLLIVVPGPDMTFFLGQTIAGGRARGFAAFFGCCLGLFVHTMMAAFGLSALLASSVTAFTVLKFAGAAYLLWLGLQVILKGSAVTFSTASEAQPIRRVFVTGLMVNLLNPKIVMFFVTFLPQFVSAGDPNAGGKLFFLGCYFIGLGIVMCSLLILAAERFIGVIRRSPRAMRVIDYLFGGLMGAFAVRLVLARD